MLSIKLSSFLSICGNLQALPNDKCVFQIFVPRINFDENVVWRKKQKIVTETEF